jgi:nitrogenase molybdenum-iron protein alpha/beta subunit
VDYIDTLRKYIFDSFLIEYEKNGHPVNIDNIVFSEEGKKLLEKSRGHILAILELIRALKKAEENVNKTADVNINLAIKANVDWDWCLEELYKEYAFLEESFKNGYF